MTDTVLVTGISGFIASHVALKLLEKGYAVRGTVRDKAKGQRVAEQIIAASGDSANIELVEADLGHDAGWEEAVKGCRFVQHIASPLPLDTPSDREALVPEARAGAQRVLEHGFSAGAEHIVMTSSIAAMIGQKNRGRHFKFGETDWSDPEWKALTAYPVSKIRAELSAWAYVKAQGLEAKLTTINPSLVLGPDPFENGGASLEIVRGMIKGEFPRAPKLAVPLVDVRDVAAIHVAAMGAKDTGGRRLIAASNTLWLSEIAAVLRAAHPQLKRLPKGEVPNILLKFMSLFDERLKIILSDLGIFVEAETGYVTSLTHVMPRPAKEAVLATAESLLAQGIAEGI